MIYKDSSNGRVNDVVAELLRLVAEDRAESAPPKVPAAPAEGGR
jgi:hypothetical protein